MKNLGLFCFRSMAENGDSVYFECTEYTEFEDENAVEGLDESVTKNLESLFKEGAFQVLNLLEIENFK